MPSAHEVNGAIVAEAVAAGVLDEIDIPQEQSYVDAVVAKAGHEWRRGYDAAAASAS